MLEKAQLLSKTEARMKRMFCWRCQAEMPMLDEEEYKTIEELYAQGVRATQKYRREFQLPFKDCNLLEFFQPLLQRYRELTGDETPIPNEVRHHRISLYGPPCEGCDKPLRTPKARLCAACGVKVPREKWAVVPKRERATR